MGINFVSRIKLLMKHIGRFALWNQLFPTISVSNVTDQLAVMFLNIIVARICASFLNTTCKHSQLSV